MQGIYRLLFAASALLVGCSSGGGEPEELSALEGSYTCDDDEGSDGGDLHVPVVLPQDLQRRGRKPTPN